MARFIEADENTIVNVELIAEIRTIANGDIVLLFAGREGSHKVTGGQAARFVEKLKVERDGK